LFAFELSSRKFWGLLALSKDFPKMSNYVAKVQQFLGNVGPAKFQNLTRISPNSTGLSFLLSKSTPSSKQWALGVTRLDSDHAECSEE